MTGFGADFKRMLSRPGPWMFTFYGFGECLPNRENYIELDKEKADAWGIPALKIHCSWRESERALLHDMTVTASEMLSAAGAKQIESFLEDNAPGLTIDEMGTARMGRDPKTSGLNAQSESHEVQHPFMSDGSRTAAAAC